MLTAGLCWRSMGQNMLAGVERSSKTMTSDVISFPIAQYTLGRFHHDKTHPFGPDGRHPLAASARLHARRRRVEQRACRFAEEADGRGEKSGRRAGMAAGGVEEESRQRR